MNIEDVALKKLSTNDRTITELKKYLFQKDFPEDEIERVISDFILYGYLDDYRYCTGYFRYAFGKGRGKKRVFIELKQRGVADNIIEEAFEDYIEEQVVDEKAMALKEAKKTLDKAGLTEGQEIPDKVKGRIARRLSALGYTSDIIFKTLDNIKRKNTWD